MDILSKHGKNISGLFLGLFIFGMCVCVWVYVCAPHAWMYAQ